MRISGLSAAAIIAVLLVGTAQAADAATAHHYANCTAMHKVHKGGIAKVGARDHRTGGGHAKYKPYVSTAAYKANTSMDRDKDGIACEQ
jgi:excalibur calcium-binding domain-containing protein